MPNFASMATSLHDVAKKSKAYQWGELQQKTFQTLKDLLCAATAHNRKIHLRP